MQQRYRKMLSVVAGVAVIAAALPLAVPQTVAANWLTDIGRAHFRRYPGGATGVTGVKRCCG